jgi:hypothetical protein
MGTRVALLRVTQEDTRGMSTEIRASSFDFNRACNKSTRIAKPLSARLTARKLRRPALNPTLRTPPYFLGLSSRSIRKSLVWMLIASTTFS